MKTIFLSATAAMLLLTTQAHAQASQLDLVYTLASTGTTVEAILDGTLSSDGLSFSVTGADSVSLNGVALSGTFEAGSLDMAFFGGNEHALGTVYLDKSMIDLFVANGSIYTPSSDGIEFAVGNYTALHYTGSDGIGATAGFGGNGRFEPFDADALTLTVMAAASPTPEPASWALMLGGFGLVGGALRSRRKVSLTFA